MVQALIFDFDGVLVDTEIVFERVERAYLEELGLTLSRAEYKDKFLGLNNSEWGPVLFPLLDAAGLDHPPEGFSEEMRARFYVAMQDHCLEMPGALDMLDRITVPKAIGTSSPRASLDKKIARTDIRARFGEMITTASDVGKPKPAPDIPTHAAGRLGLPTSECLVIEDSVTGVRAARAAGCGVWGFLGGSHSDADFESKLLDAGAERVFPDMDALLARFIEDGLAA